MLKTTAGIRTADKGIVQAMVEIGALRIGEDGIHAGDQGMYCGNGIEPVVSVLNRMPVSFIQSRAKNGLRVTIEDGVIAGFSMEGKRK